MKKVVIESPFKGQGETKAEVARSALTYRRYLRRAIADCFKRGEAPFASHGLYPGALDDDDDTQRNLGMNAGFVWGELAELVVVYSDYGTSKGMEIGVRMARERGAEVEHRLIGKNPRPASKKKRKQAAEIASLMRG